jgi:hypothetical protein
LTNFDEYDNTGSATCKQPKGEDLVAVVKEDYGEVIKSIQEKANKTKTG